MTPLQGKEQTRYWSVRHPERRRGAFVFNSPHSGRDYPRSFIEESRLCERRLRSSEDYLVDELFSGVPGHGAPLISARFPRAWLDVNREPLELDPSMFDGPLPATANTKSARVRGGLGTIARIVAEGEEIYSQPVSVGVALARIENVYLPYHRRLRELLHDAFRNEGYAVLVDCHSMPSSTGRAKPLLSSFYQQADFVIGDRFSTSCSPLVTDTVASILRGLGYRVAINKPYAGGYITEHYGNPVSGFHAVQIEVNRGLYMDEASIARSRGFDRLREDLDIFAGRLLNADWSALEGNLRQAAE